MVPAAAEGLPTLPRSVPPALAHGSETAAPGKPSALKSVFRNAAASTLGASVVALLVTPLDVVKVRLQTHVCPVGGVMPCADPKHVGGTADAVRKIMRTEGPRGLWRGLPVTLVLAVPTTGLYFTMYEAIRARTGESYPGISQVTSASFSGACARIITATAASPLELARTSLQAGVGGPNATVASVLSTLHKRDGFFALWRGLCPTLMRDAPFSAIYWSSYESLKTPDKSPFPHHFFVKGNEMALYLGAGVGAGGLAAFLTIPADVVKTRRQTFHGPSSGTKLPSSTLSIAHHIVLSEGVRGLFKGAGPRIAKVAPACAIMMGSYELFQKLFGG